MPSRDIIVVPGVMRTDCDWCHYFQGTMEALIAAGVAKRHWFSDWTERWSNGNVVRKKDLMWVGGVKISTTRPRHGLCTVRYEYEKEQKCFVQTPRQRAYTINETHRVKYLQISREVDDLKRHIDGSSHCLGLSEEILKSISMRIGDVQRLLLRMGPTSEKVTLGATRPRANDVSFQRFMSKLLPTG